MQKFSDSCERNETVSPHQYCLVDYGNPSNGQYHPYHPYPQVINQLGNLPGLLQYNIGTIHQVPMLQIGVHSGVNTEISQLKRSSLGSPNLVETRKNDRY